MQFEEATIKLVCNVNSLDRQRNVFVALPEVLEEVAVGNTLVESSDSYLAGLIHDSCSQAEDSESRVVVITPSSQRSPTPRISTPGRMRAALGSPAP